MKRSAELQALSRQHHSGLVAARRLRLAARGTAGNERPESLTPAITHFQNAWHDEIQPHFRTEEAILLPAFARAVPADDPLIVRTLTEHVALRRAVRDLEKAAAESRQPLAGEIGESLEAHIRFEERILFPAIEAALAGPPLAELGRELLDGLPAERNQAEGSCPVRG